MFETLDMIDRLRRERAEAWERALIFTQYADRLEAALIEIRDHSSENPLTCPEIADITLAHAGILYSVEQHKYEEKKNAAEK